MRLPCPRASWPAPSRRARCPPGLRARYLPHRVDEAIPWRRHVQARVVARVVLGHFERLMPKPVLQLPDVGIAALALTLKHQRPGRARVPELVDASTHRPWEPAIRVLLKPLNHLLETDLG